MVEEEYDKVFDEEKEEETEEEPETEESEEPTEEEKAKTRGRPRKRKYRNITEIKEKLRKIGENKYLIQKELKDMKEMYEGEIKTLHVTLFGNPLDKRFQSKIDVLKTYMEEYYLKDLPVLKAIEPVTRGITDLQIRYKKLHGNYKDEIYKTGSLLDETIDLCRDIVSLYDEFAEESRDKEKRILKKKEEEMTQELSDEYMEKKGNEILEKYHKALEDGNPKQAEGYKGLFIGQGMTYGATRREWEDLFKKLLKGD